APRPGLVTWSNNALDWSHMANEAARDVGTEQCLRNMATGHKLISADWGKPAAMLICAGGFSFYGERTWLNERIFWVDTEAVCRKLGETYRDERFFSALPGQTFSMEGNRLTKVDDSTPFLSVAPREEWPARGRRVGPHTPDYTPATGRYDLDERDAKRLHDSLNE